MGPEQGGDCAEDREFWAGIQHDDVEEKRVTGHRRRTGQIRHGNLPDAVTRNCVTTGTTIRMID